MGLIFSLRLASERGRGMRTRINEFSLMTRGKKRAGEELLDGGFWIFF